MAKFAYYGIINGDNNMAVFSTWSECEKFRSKNPTGAKFKGFHTQLDALDWLQDLIRKNSESASDCKPEAKKPTKTAKPKTESIHNQNAKYGPNCCIAYTDGSYNAETQVYGYGVRLSDADDLDQNVCQFFGCGSKFASARNVAGECAGAIRAVQEAINHGYQKIIIRHDYMGVGAWVTGQWANTNAPVSQDYKTRMLEQKPFIEICFEWVHGHSGEKYNDEVDMLAKSACGVN